MCIWQVFVIYYADLGVHTVPHALLLCEGSTEDFIAKIAKRGV